MDPLALKKHGEAVGDPPVLPYTPTSFPFGNLGKTRLCKVYPGRTWGDWCTDEELAVLEYVKWLEAEVAVKRDAELDKVNVASLPDLLAPTVPAEPVTPVSTATTPIVEPVATLTATTAPVASTDADPSPKPVTTGDGAKGTAEAFLRDTLKAGPVPASEVATMAAAAGISESTLKRAKQELGVVSRKAGLTGWNWELPAEGGQVAEVVPPMEAGQTLVEETQPVPV